MRCCQPGKEHGSPDRNLFADAEKFHGVPDKQEATVEHTWTLGGTYANWKMTVTVTAPDHLDESEVADFPVRQFENLGRQFHDAVNLYECLRYQDDRTRASIYGSRMY